MRWTAVLAVKQLTDAKSRLADHFDEDVRRQLVLAMLADTLSAVLPEVADTAILVSPDADVLAAANALGAQAVPEPAGGTGSINGAFALGLAAAWRADPSVGVLIVQADLPAVRPAELSAAAAAAERVLTDGAAAAFVPDRDGSGTTTLFAAPPGSAATADSAAAQQVPLHFGPGSAAAHAAVGAIELTGNWPGLRADVDTPEDLLVVTDLGVGAATAPLLTHRVR
ncbi:2-phospho-L-lactate guanylyltransferase [Jongsikchunia kroppenstedtii]|uniref:2-phospho-L-lactate guanylyltransferase n=1 Tax=Jongsikchunia kroppenstedtii TaxID=1121721 RepID=UPI0009D9B325|nr:2-phospho-L-lactate guanylyltransferase [Jongsikchunia kroppenstedtii]